MKKCAIFFVGTTAEYIKVFTVMEHLLKKGVDVRVIASGQNEIIKTDIAKNTKLKIDLQLSKEDDIVKNAVGLFSWFFKTMKTAAQKIKESLLDIDFKNSVMIVHGDTVSTVMGALVGKKLGMKIAHIEAGLRSHNIFSPFPEEIDRNIVSKLADFNFCQNQDACNNLTKVKGKVINTEYNTIIDALNFSYNIPCENVKVKEILKDNYSVFVLHRQENLLKSSLVKDVVSIIIERAKTEKVVFILHTITKNTLQSLGLLETLKKTPNVILFDRVEYFDFMKLLSSAKFVITDGGSNQEELSYMGKPTMIVRTSTERIDGIGQNIIMYNKNTENIKKFIQEYEKYRRELTVYKTSPSEIIANNILEVLL